MLRMKITFALVGALLAAGVTLAQEPRNQNPTNPSNTNPSQTSRDQRDGDKRDGDKQSGAHELIAVKLAENRNEIELAKLAQQKSQNEQVRQFAAKMIKDHQKAEEMLNKHAGHWGGKSTSTDRARDTDDKSPPKTGSETNASTNNTRRDPSSSGASSDQNATQRPSGQATAGREGSSLNWVAIHQQLAEQCLASAKRELNSKEGAEFDKCYMGMQVVAHQKMIDMDNVFLNYVSADSRDTVAECMKTAQEHLREAKEIMNDIKDKPSTRTATRESRE